MFVVTMWHRERTMFSLKKLILFLQTYLFEFRSLWIENLLEGWTVAVNFIQGSDTFEIVVNLEFHWNSSTMQLTSWRHVTRFESGCMHSPIAQVSIMVCLGWIRAQNTVSVWLNMGVVGSYMTILWAEESCVYKFTEKHSKIPQIPN